MSQLDFIHQFVAAEAQGEGKRVLLLLHGTGGDENQLLPLGRELDPRASYLSVRGKVSENGMPRFFRRLAEGVFDEEDVVRRAQELGTFVTAAAASYQFAVAQLVVVGYSNGANIAAGMMLLGLASFPNAVLFRGMVPLEPAGRPRLNGTRVLVSSGDADPIIPSENSERLARLLQSGGAEVTLVRQSAGHGLVAADVELARKWLSQL